MHILKASYIHSHNFNQTPYLIGKIIRVLGPLRVLDHSRVMGPPRVQGPHKVLGTHRVLSPHTVLGPHRVLGPLRILGPVFSVYHNRGTCSEQFTVFIWKTKVTGTRYD